ncbi:MAG: protoheme IX farnesyltransferase [Thermoplasmata archaeon]
MGGFIREFFIMTKPRVWVFLLITGIAGEVFALSILREPDFLRFIFVALYITIGLMGAESISNYFDLPIDRVMKRTMSRPLPSGRMKPEVALYGGLILVAVMLLMASFQSLLSLVFMATGVFDYTVIYAYLTKRKTSWNIILGAYSGGAPLLAGFYAFYPRFNILSILLFAVIMIWTPLHIWTLSIRYMEDYSRASVPMLPVVLGPRRTMIVLFPVSVVLTSAAILSGYEMMLYFPEFTGIFVLAVFIALGLYILLSYLRALLSQGRIMKLFSATNAFIGAFFMAVAIFSLLIPFIGVYR